MYLALLQISMTDTGMFGPHGSIAVMHDIADKMLQRVNTHWPDLASSALGLPPGDSQGKGRDE
jgi:hypothetical protein